MSSPGALPGRIDPQDIKPWVLALITGIVLLIVGAVVGDITAAIGKYIITTLQAAGNFTMTTAFLDQVIGVVGPVFMITGVALIAVAAVGIIKLLMEAFKGPFAGA